MNPTKMLSWVIDRVQISRCELLDDRYVKIRRPGLGWIVALGNVYKRLSGARIALFLEASAWQRHEMARLREAHPRLGVWPRSGGGITMEPLPGEPLRAALVQGGQAEAALWAAGRELRRCHALASGTFAHGDPHLGNILFDGATKQAFLIDFETIYLPAIPVDLRRVNDLLVILQELLALAPDAGWPGWPLALLAGYDDATLLPALREELQPPRGLGRLLWASRTRRVPWATVEQRLASLRAALG
jgi:hypothetical protein